MPHARRWFRALLLTATAAGFAPAVRADVDPAVQKALPYLRSRASGQQVGETALVALALLKAEVPAGDPAVSGCIGRLRSRFSSDGYKPERNVGPDVYEAAVVAMAMSNLGAESGSSELAAIAAFLVSRQNSNGSWDYQGRPFGDTSISQYAVLGLWEAENGGARVDPRVWDKAAQFFLSVQGPAGSWNYHRDEAAQYPDTISMTAAGVGSLLICQRQLSRYRRGGESTTSILLTAVGSEKDVARYDVETPASKIDTAVKAGLSWLGSHFTTNVKGVAGQSPFYALYGIERIGALADRESIGRFNWFDVGRQYIQGNQRGDGAWDGAHGELPNTVWAVLFLTKSTQKTIRRVEVKRLGGGTLLGGRGLPKDLGNLTVAGGRVVARPMNGAVEGMLAVLEDPRAENADSALTGLVARYRSEGSKAVKPYKDRFRKMLTDRDPGLRKVAAWALARTEDIDVAPFLIEAVNDPDESVVVVASEGLQLLSRKIKSLGPPSPSTPEQRQEAAKRWREWYLTVRPLDVEGQQDELSAATPRSPR